jgi:hypothetical protein
MSTALMYSFAQRSDTRVLDEPLYGHFLRHTGAQRPCREATLSARPCTVEGVLDFMKPTKEEQSEGQTLFCKHMANHIHGIPWTAFKGHRHVILFRNPAAVMSSYSAHIESPSMLDLGYASQLELLQSLDAAGTPPVVVCSDKLQASPEHILEALCSTLGLPWEPGMMAWEPGARAEDGPWAPWWYKGVHASTGWEARPVKTHLVPEHLLELHGACLGAYHALLERAL